MTMQELKQLRSIRAEITRISKRLDRLRKKSALSDDEETRELIKELYNELKAHYKKQIEAELKITRQIKLINDAQARLSIEMVYIDGCSWREVAAKIGGGNTEDGCRKYLNRYLRNLSEMSQTE